MIRRFGQPPQSGKTYTQRPGAYAVLLRGNDVLLTYQAGLKPEIQLPGGGIDPDESPLHALHREVFEETGWAIDKPLKIGAFRRFVYMPEYSLMAEKLCHIYLARPTLRRSDPIEAEHTDIWVPADIAPDMTDNPGDRHFLRRVLSRL